VLAGWQVREGCLGCVKRHAGFCLLRGLFLNGVVSKEDSSLLLGGWFWVWVLYY